MLLEPFQRARKVLLTPERFSPAGSGAVQPRAPPPRGWCRRRRHGGPGERMLLVLLPLLLLPPALAERQRAAVLRLGLRGSPRGEVNPAFLSLTLDASLARDPRYVALLR